MRKYLIFLLLLLMTNCQAQITPAPIYRIQDSTTIFVSPIMAGAIICDIQTGKTYRILRPIPGSKKLSTLTVNVDFVLFTGVEVDPVASAILGLVKSNGTTIAAAVPVTDYMPGYSLLYQSEWVTSTDYSVGDIVRVPGEGTELGDMFWFMARLAHHSSGSYLPENITDLGYWNLIHWQKAVGAAQIQSDYAQANSAALDYIKNKPYVISDRQMILKIASDATTTTIGDGKLIFCIPSEMNGFHLTKVEAFNTTTGAGVTTIQIRNITAAADMLSTLITIDTGELTSYTATPSVIISGQAHVSTGNLIAIDVDAIAAGSKGLGVIFTFNYIP